MIHVLPVGDAIEHEHGLDCPCDPDVEWIDPATGATYPSGPVVVHHSLDGREHDEPDHPDSPTRRGA